MEQHPFGWLSLAPPLVAIIFAIATRRVVVSLLVGILAGALLMAGGNPFEAIYHTWETHLWSTLVDPSKLRVFSFTILMGAMVGVITQSGGMRGLIDLISPYANNRRRGQLATWVVGLLIFFDDYANTMLVGNTLRPVFDRLKISREKLAYLVDSTAAPVAALAPVSTWVAVEIDYIANGLESIAGTEMTAFGLFIESIPYRFYIWSALLLVPITVVLRRDIGPLVGAERRAHSKHVDEVAKVRATVDEPPSSSWLNAALPILTTLGFVIYLLWTTGSQGACDAAGERSIRLSKTMVDDDATLEAAFSTIRQAAASGSVSATKLAIDDLAQEISSMNGLTVAEVKLALQRGLHLRDIVGAADSSLALQYGSLAGLSFACLLPLVRQEAKLDQLLAGAASGARIVLPAIAILWCASAMSRMTTDVSVDGERSDVAYAFREHRLYTADFLTQVFSGSDASKSEGQSVSTQFLPTIVFVLAAFVAFCTGTSWGTMGILIPMVVQMGHAMLTAEGVDASSHPILLGSIGGVLAGAVFGDHCSPISDTTVLSSQASGCDHLAHVWTQMPYALLAAGASILLGTLPIGFGVPVWPLVPVQAISLFALVKLFGTQSPE